MRAGERGRSLNDRRVIIVEHRHCRPVLAIRSAGISAGRFLGRIVPECAYGVYESAVHVSSSPGPDTTTRFCPAGRHCCVVNVTLSLLIRSVVPETRTSGRRQYGENYTRTLDTLRGFKGGFIIFFFFSFPPSAPHHHRPFLFFSFFFVGFSKLMDAILLHSATSICAPIPIYNRTR